MSVLTRLARPVEIPLLERCGYRAVRQRGGLVEMVRDEATVAALYVETGGCYFNVPGIDPWDETRDARLYAGPHPVVCHPPCQRWGKFYAGQPLFIKQTGIRKIKGDDAGCFEAALSAVRSFGGILEHPRDSHAWAHFNLNEPPRRSGWVAADMYGGWTCCVEQGRYGHYARKPTWLYAFGCTLPELDWGESEARLDPAIIERMGLKCAKRLGEVGARGGGKDSAPRIGTPPPFRDLLISIARTAGQSADRDKDEQKLPDWDDLRGVAPDATGDLSSEEFVRKIRSEWPDKDAERLAFEVMAEWMGANV